MKAILDPRQANHDPKHFMANGAILPNHEQPARIDILTAGALAATGNGYHRGGNGAPLNGVTRMPFDGYLGPDVDTSEILAKMLADPSGGVDAPAAILVEPVQGEGGLNAASGDWLRKIERIARDHGALLIVDDIQAGCGRTGDFFGFEEAGLKPDLVTMAKSVSGFGLPMGLVLVKPEHDIMGPAEHNGTFRGNTHAFVTARVAIEKFWADKSFEEDIARRADIIAEGLGKVAAMVHDSRLKGRGMMRGVDVGSGELASAICGRCFEKGLVIETSGPEDEVVKILAPLTTPDETLREGLRMLEESAREVLQERSEAQIAAE